MNEPSAVAPDSIPVIVMDDSRSARFALGKFLEGMGCQVRGVADEPALMAALDAQPAAMMIIEHDPADRGFEQLHRIKAHPNAVGTPVVLSLSDAVPGFDDQAFAHGAAAVMIKPPSRDSMAALVDGLLGGSQRTPPIEPARGMDQRAALIAQQVAEQAADLRDGIARLATSVNNADSIDADRAPAAARDHGAPSHPTRITEPLQALESRLVALERNVETELMELRVQIDLSLRALSERIDQSCASLQAMVVEQAQAAAERTVTTVAGRISERLAESILKTLSRNPTNAQDPSSSTS